MTTYGYARVSTTDQDYSLQETALLKAGCSLVRAEKASGTALAGRAELDLLMQFMRAGDTLMVTRIDRLARSIRDLQNIVYELRQRGIALRATEQPIDTSTAAGKAFLDMLGFLLSSRPISGVNAKPKASLRPRPRAGTEAASPRSIRARSLHSVLRAWGLRQSQIGWVSTEPRSTGPPGLIDRSWSMFCLMLPLQGSEAPEAPEAPEAQSGSGSCKAALASLKREHK
jgi:hypothetical protein